jgi:hypothetical protein
LYQLEKKLARWKAAREVQILRKKLLAEVDAGYIRVRIRLKNDDLLELSEYFSGETGELQVISSTYHWQDAQGQFKKRWDNAPHHPHVTTYPFHLHNGSEQNVLDSAPMTIDKMMKLINKELKRPGKKKE